jgi:hypothetical protein
MLSSQEAPTDLPFLRRSETDGNESFYGTIDESFKTSETNDDVELEPSIDFTCKEDTPLRGSYKRAPLMHQKMGSLMQRAASQIPAIALVTLFHLMVGIPFGVSYFPVSWRSSNPSAAMASSDDDAMTNDHNEFLVEGTFPIAGKEALGIRMFLFSTIVGQLVMTFASNFPNCIALQMVENVPFCQSLTAIVVEVQGYGKEALSTLFFLFGLASVIVGLVFYLLGKFSLGRILYFFPTHVLVGCIGKSDIFYLVSHIFDSATYPHLDVYVCRWYWYFYSKDWTGSYSKYQFLVDS